MRTALILLTLLARTWALAGTFTIHVQAPHVAGEVVTLLRYDDLLTLRTVLLTRALLDPTGRDVLDQRAGQGPGVDPLVLVELGVLDGQDGLHHALRDLVEADGLTVLVTVQGGQQRAVAEHLAGLAHALHRGRVGGDGEHAAERVEQLTTLDRLGEVGDDRSIQDLGRALEERDQLDDP